MNKEEQKSPIGGERNVNRDITKEEIYSLGEEIKSGFALAMKSAYNDGYTKGKEEANNHPAAINNIINAPKRIYLQIGDDLSPENTDFNSLSDVTWSAGQEVNHTIEYILKEESEREAVEIKEFLSVPTISELWRYFQDQRKLKEKQFAPDTNFGKKANPNNS